MGEPLISICIPTYNGEKYLRECLDSCISQTFTNFEILICDDRSQDATPNIVSEYQARHAGIRFYQNDKNLGLAANWNRCLQLAGGAWIKLLFQDDAMAPHCLQRFYENMQSGYDLIVCKRHFILDKETTADERDYYARRVRTLENTGHYASGVFSAAAISKIAAANIALNFIGEPPLTLFKKELPGRFGGFDESLKQICDLEFFLRIASNTGLKYIPEQLCRFRIHAQSTTEKNTTAKNYRLNHLETLLFALRLLTGPRFAALRSHLSLSNSLKLKLYVKYKSYLAFKAIQTTEDREEYLELEKEYKEQLFKKYERVYLSLLAVIRS